MPKNYYTYSLINHLYFPEDLNPDEEHIIERYIKENSGNKDLSYAIHVPDIITNINGNHEYKILSAKDIDFENVFLENSTVNEACWGSFDESRRWGNDTAVRINEVYELMNVIDYLLCSCRELYSEINNIKYTVNAENLLWFVSNVKSDNASFFLKYKLSTRDFENGNANYLLNVTYLDPERNYVTINTTRPDTFGISTSFRLDTTDFSSIDDKYKFTRIVKNPNALRKLNGINAFINEKPESSDMNYNSSTLTTNSQGIEINIYGYRIGNDLKIYPGFDILNFLSQNGNNVFTDMSKVVDVENKKLKNEESYFKYAENNFKKIYVEFLGNSENSQYNNTYILYFIDGDQKSIIYFSKQISENDNGTFNTADIELFNTALDNITNNYNTYKKHIFQNVTGQYESKTLDNIIELPYIVPYIYTISSSNSIELSVTTPKTQTFDSSTESIIIKYYKKPNNLTYNIYNNTSDKPIGLYDELNQSDVILTNSQRYGLPENSEIQFNIEADIINDETSDNLRLDDEYKDIIYSFNNINDISDSDYNKYYIYTKIENNKRIFNKFTDNNQFKEYLVDNIFLIKGEANYVHLWEKIENPYSLSYNLTVSQLLNQNYNFNYNFDKVQSIVSYINQNCIQKTNYNTLLLSYSLPEDVEQLKFDLDLRIKETSKVQEVYKKIPCNLNKIHNITINFNSPILFDQEAQKFKNTCFTVAKDNNTTIGNIIDYSNTVSAYEVFSTYSGDFNTITNMDILSYLNSSINDDSTITVFNKITYDNTVSGGNILNISYDPIAYYVNLIGGKHLNNKFKNNSYSYLVYMYGGSEGTSEINQNYSQIFSIHDLGLNYYCHGGDSYITYIFNPNNSVIRGYVYAPYSHSLLTPCESYNDNIGNYTNLGYYLGIALEHNMRNETGDGISLNFVSSLRVTGDTADNEKIEYNGEFMTYNKIVTNDIEIHKYNFSYDMVNQYNRYEQDQKRGKTTYVIHSAYIKVLNSTFYPSINCYPKIYKEGENKLAYYDLNNADDIQRYLNYKNYWKSDTENNEDQYYQPITLSLKYLENNNKNIPLFTESNIAKLKFNIIRKKIEGIDLPGLEGSFGDGETLYITLGSRYYLSDFLKYSISGSLENKLYCGSYMYSENNNNVISFKDKKLSTNNNNNKFHILDNNGAAYIYPISSKYIDNNLNNLYYNYDIERIAELNKLNLSINVNSSDYANKICSINTDLSYVDFKLPSQSDISDENNNIKDILGEFLVNGISYDQSRSEFKVTISIKYNTISGSKNYKSLTGTGTTSGAVFRCKFINRIHSIDNHGNSLFKHITTNDITYDIFEYKRNLQEFVIIDKQPINNQSDQSDPNNVKYYYYNIEDYLTENSNYYQAEVEAFLDNRIAGVNELSNNSYILWTGQSNVEINQN